MPLPTISRSKPTFIPVNSGYIVVSPMTGGDFWVKGPRERGWRVNSTEVNSVVRELMQRFGPARLESAAALVNILLENVDDLDAKQLTQMALRQQSSACGLPCPRCGQPCTLIHYTLPNGTRMPPYHICQTCDLKTAEVAEGLDDPEHSKIRCKR